TFQFTNNSSGDYTACEWDFGDGTPKVTDCAPQHQYASTGAYQACLSLTGPGGEDQSCVNLSIPEVEANFSADRVSGPAPLLVNFIQLSSNGFQYLWDFGDGGTSDSPQPVHVYEQPGAYTVTLTAKGYGGEDTLTMEDFIYVGLGRFRLYVPMLTR
ncbi:MAG TPA: PKD domain-containing protein, partial [Anaerolineaceae bacterium]|nr:PKD domain-containing protein [Anaerolineaceae bacterium]